MTALDDLCESPSFGLAEGATFFNHDFVAFVGFIVFVMSGVLARLGELFLLDRMRLTRGDFDSDSLVTLVGGHDPNQ